MADFHQTGPITTLHRLGGSGLQRLETELVEVARHRPMALVLPCLSLELQDEGLKRVTDALAGVSYLRQIVVSISAPDRASFDAVAAAFAGVSTWEGEAPTFLWADGPAVASLCKDLAAGGLAVGLAGKGQAVWLAYGYLLGTDRVRSVALHDCDIRDYQRELLARLVYPVAHPNLDYSFAKGYYPRLSERLYGRVTRLLVTPLLRALRAILGPHDLLEFLDAFRYPLAGECAMSMDLVASTRVPNDWGLEIATLVDVFRNTAPKRVCQVELAENYDHRHRELSPDDPSAGLHRMVIDITASLIRSLAGHGVEFDSAFLNTLIVSYRRTAQEAIERYRDDAALNGLIFDAHAEELAAETFSKGLLAAGLEFVKDPLGAPPIPSWNRVMAAMPGFLERLREKIEAETPPRGCLGGSGKL